jgi:hypothetical protein
MAKDWRHFSKGDTEMANSVHEKMLFITDHQEMQIKTTMR